MNLNKRLIIITSFTAMLTGIIIFVIVYNIFSQVLEERFQKRISLTAKHFAAAASIGIVFNDINMVKKLAQPLLKDEEIEGIEVRKKENIVILTLGKPSKYQITIPITSGETEETLLFNPRQENTLGSVVIFYNRKKLDELLRKIFIRILLISFFISALSSFAGYFLISKAVYTPLRELLTAVREMEKGNLDVKISGGNLPETKELANAFSSMLGALKKHQEILEKTYKEMARNQFMADIGKFSLTIAHEIKNPLGIIKGAIDILKKGVDEKTKEQMISFIKEETERIDKLIKDFLQLSRPDKLNLKNINAKSMLQSLKEKFQIQYPDIKIYVNCPEAEIKTDPYILERILSNLIRNSIEAEASEIQIILTVEENSYQIRVIDNGKGIEEKEKENIFKPFYTTKKAGSGLGLTMVLQAVYALGGEIKVESEKGKGSTFILTFPKAGEENG